MVIKAIKDRKSIRNYVPKANVSDVQIKELLEPVLNSRAS